MSDDIPDVEAFAEAHADLHRVAEAPPAHVAFHRHLEICGQCADQPFNLCPTGARLLRAAVDAGDRP